MEFTKIISSPVFAASAPDIGLEAQSASPVKIVVTTPSASWDITLSPVSDADGKNLLNIRLRDILSAVASAPDPSGTEPNSAIPLLMVNLSASNTEGEQASMDIPVAFGTLNGKDPKDFTGQWLTSREQICLTYSWARERLSLIFGPQLLRWSGSVSLSVNCRAYYASGKARNFQLVSAESSDTVYYSVDCSYSAISALDDSGEQLVAWDLSYTLSGINADGESDSVDSFPQRFILANQDGRIREYIFANCFGMEDRVFGEGVARREVNGSSSTFVNGGKTLEVSNDAEIVYEAFSGQLADRRAVFHWYDFLSSSSRLIFSAADGAMTHIVVEGHDSETDDFSVGGVSFSYRLSEKNGVYPDGLCGTIGDYDPNQQYGALWVGDDPQAACPAEEDLFFLKHRLSEFQTLTASDALLLLVQSPATDAWGSVSLGSIKSWIKKFLDGESREIRLNSLADYETDDGKVIDPAKLQNGSIPVWDAAAGAYHPVPASELGDYGINPKLYPLVFQKGEDVVLTYTPNVGKAVLDISDFASAETLSTHISDKDIHVTAEQMALWNKVGGLFDLDADGNVYVKDNRGFYGNSFISARGSDPDAGSGGSGGGLDVQAMWYALGQPTNEKINASHIPVIGMDKVDGLADALAGKLSGITGEMVTAALGYTPYNASQIGSASVAYAASAGKVAHALSIVAGDVTTVYDGSAAKSVTVPTAEQMALWNKVGGLFDLDADGNVYVKDNRGFYGNSFISARGSDPGAGIGGGSGVDMDSVWYALAQPTNEKINASHIPAIGMDKVSGLADALAGYLPLAGGAMSGNINLLGANSSTLRVQMRDDDSNYRRGIAWESVNHTLIAEIGYKNAGQLIYLNPISNEITDVWVDAVGKYSLVISKDLLTYNTYPILHSGNYTSYTVTKTGGGASGKWPISVSGTAGKVENALTINNDGGSSSASAKTYNGSSAVTISIPTTLPASDVYAWAKAATKPSYTWGEIGGKPTEFTPAPHTHVKADITDFPTSWAWSAITGKPSTLAGYGITDGVNSVTAAGGLSASVSGHKLTVGVASGYAVPTSAQIGAWNLVASLFGVDADGNVYVKDNRGFWSNSFISARGSDPEAGSGGGSGADMASVWYALGQPTNEKINVSHIPLLQQLSGTLTNAQLANSSLSVAGVTVALGGAVSAEQIAGALGLESALDGKLNNGSTTYDTAYARTFTINNVSYGLWSIANPAAIGPLFAPSSAGTSGYILQSTGGVPAWVSRAALTQQLFAGYKGCVAIPENSDLDDYTTPGLYFCPANATVATIANVPNTAAFSLVVLQTAGVIQIFREYGYGSNANEYTRRYYGGSWTTWVRAPRLNELYTKTEADGRYLKLTGGTVTGNIVFSGATNATSSIKMSTETSNYRVGVQWESTNEGTKLGEIGYWNTQQRIYLNALADEVTDVWNDAVGNYSLIVGKNLLTYNTYPLLHSGNYTNYTVSRDIAVCSIGVSGTSLLAHTYNGGTRSSVSQAQLRTMLGLGSNAYTSTEYLPKSSYTASDILAKLKTVDGSGSGLDADLLDGYQATALSRLLSYINSGTKTAAGWYRVFTASPDRTNALGVNIILHLARSYYQTNNEAYTFCISVAFNNQVDITQVSGLANTRLITKIRVVSVNSGALYVDFYLSTATNGDTYYVSGTGPGYFQAATAVSTVVGNVTEFSTSNGCKSDRGFVGSLSGNASSATKLATARSIWGQTFDGTQDVDGHLYLGSSDYRLYFGKSGVTSFLTSANGIFRLYKANNTSAQRMLFAVDLGSENVGIGTATPTDKLHVIGTIRATTGIWSDGYVSAKGQDTTSDARYKRDVAALPAQAALAVLMRLRPSTWSWRDDGRRGAGFVAQEVTGVLPEAVREVGNGEDRHLALNYQMLHAYEVCLLQTHEERLTKLENEIKRIQHGS